MSSRVPLSCFVLVLAVLTVSAIAPYDRFTWWLEVVPILIALPILLVTYKKFRFTNMLYVLMALHMTVLAVGGHYTYARVPLFDAQWIKDFLHVERNSYDGLGHLAQGFIPAMIARELLIRTSTLKPGKWMFALIVLGCLGIGALYEIIEWLAAISSKEGAGDFLGTQGDEWDTQKDMALAGVGAVLALLSLHRVHDKALKKI